MTKSTIWNVCYVERMLRAQRGNFNLIYLYTFLLISLGTLLITFCVMIMANNNGQFCVMIMEFHEKDNKFHLWCFIVINFFVSHSLSLHERFQPTATIKYNHFKLNQVAPYFFRKYFKIYLLNFYHLFLILCIVLYALYNKLSDNFEHHRGKWHSICTMYSNERLHLTDICWKNTF